MSECGVGIIKKLISLEILEVCTCFKIHWIDDINCITVEITDNKFNRSEELVSKIIATINNQYKDYLLDHHVIDEFNYNFYMDTNCNIREKKIKKIINKIWN